MRTRRTLNGMRRQENELKQHIMGNLENLEAEHGHSKFLVGEFELYRNYQAGSARIDGTKLLELGVSPDIIAAATVHSPYWRLDIKEIKE